MEGDRGREPGRIGGRRGAGGGKGEGVSGTPKMAGTGSTGEKFCNIAQHFTKEIKQRGENPDLRGREA